MRLFQSAKVVIFFCFAFDIHTINHLLSLNNNPINCLQGMKFVWNFLLIQRNLFSSSPVKISKAVDAMVYKGVVAVCQMKATENKTTNLKTCKDLIASAKRLNAQVRISIISLSSFEIGVSFFSAEFTMIFQSFISPLLFLVKSIS